ncbi:DUF1800 domain-containing protein [Octadecabacter ascidiaceicola]|uniref:DUF1800 domain-containing protein n=1 Tax=Octadecabacter ascidiaceicola TaxID=1655543 RepID=A0A238JU76_9RHOB|nr:DUF1800 domain-containing protein [Octadecabacter ascidiaceicola]SMX33744.1 hypothetical protein OCA8868_01012 [Octadecabacter ascidiaceicola]
MPFDPTIAAIRFGMGLSPTIAPPVSVADMLARLAGPDTIAAEFPIPTYKDVYPSPLDYLDATRALNAARGTDDEAAADEQRRQVGQDGGEAMLSFVKADLNRAAHTEDGFRERLVRFWADHFTARSTKGINRHLVSPYIEEAIRPFVMGDFAEMLIAVVSSPMMIWSLDQHQSMGPNSRAARNNVKGLNENLARELLELHTLGVGSAYQQTDVRELAELLTGVYANVQEGGVFRPARAEPGAERVLGVEYGGGEVASIEEVNAGLRGIAIHPDTARHLARKLVVHFITPTPDGGLVDAMAARYLEDNGALMGMYGVMLEHETAWAPDALKVKQPFDFIASSIRALGVSRDEIMNAEKGVIRRSIQRPMTVMGQTWQRPVGPDGWPEEEENWITPQGMAGRITWSMQMPRTLLDRLPDPRDFVFTALGPKPPEAVLFAANAAETVSDGVGLVLASAAFQRR